MTQAYLEHTNISVSDPDKTAQLMCDLFDWKIRWAGASMDKGYTVHVGGESSYLALYTNKKLQTENKSDHSTLLNLNHVAIVVSDLKKIKAAARSIGLVPFNFGEYDPGKRFYIKDDDGLEIEIVSYT